MINQQFNSENFSRHNKIVILNAKLPNLEYAKPLPTKSYAMFLVKETLLFVVNSTTQTISHTISQIYTDQVI